MCKKLIMIMMVLFSSQLLAEKIYKWVDENGQIHYSSKKPANQEVETMKLKKAPKVAAKTITDATDKPEATEDASTEVKTEEEVEAEAEAKAVAAAKLAEADKINNKKQCDLARKNYAALNATVRVSRKNDKGETVRMTDDERVNAMQTAQKGIKQYCK